MATSEQIGWIIGFNAGANWELTPMLDRKYDEHGKCTNMVKIISPDEEGYQDPISAFENRFNMPVGSSVG